MFNMSHSIRFQIRRHLILTNYKIIHMNLETDRIDPTEHRTGLGPGPLDRLRFQNIIGRDLYSSLIRF